MNNYKHALDVLVTAAETRKDQWAGVGRGERPDSLIDELWDSASTGDLEAQKMERLISDAIHTVAVGESLIDSLDRAESMLSEMIQEAQTDAEEASGTDLVVSEDADADPDLDDARGHIRDALDLLNGRR